MTKDEKTTRISKKRRNEFRKSHEESKGYVLKEISKTMNQTQTGKKEKEGRLRKGEDG